MALPINAVIAIMVGETIEIAHLFLGLMTGIFIQGSGFILFRLANVFTQNLGINAIYYATPCLTIIWLLILQHPLTHSHYLLAGTAAIINRT